MITVYFTTASKDEAKKISKALLEKRLVACTTFFPTESMYWWKNEIQNEEEVIVLCKTKEDKFEEVEQEIKKLHSYDTPAIYSWKTDKINKKYKEWVTEETK